MVSIIELRALDAWIHLILTIIQWGGDYYFSTLQMEHLRFYFIYLFILLKASFLILDFIYFQYQFVYFNWRLITILYWFCHTLIWIHHRCPCVPHPEPLSHLPPHTIPLGHPSAPALTILYHASNLDWWFDSHMIIYMFQCYSPKLSHPCHPTESKRHLCLFCCLTYRVIVTIFLNSIYMRYYTVLVFFFLAYINLFDPE